MFDDINREIRIIEARLGNVVIGKFVDMCTMRRVLGQLSDKVSYSSYFINEKRNENMFWKLIRDGYIIEKGLPIEKTIFHQKIK